MKLGNGREDSGHGLDGTEWVREKVEGSILKRREKEVWKSLNGRKVNTVRKSARQMIWTKKSKRSRFVGTCIRL